MQLLLPLLPLFSCPCSLCHCCLCYCCCCLCCRCLFRVAIKCKRIFILMRILCIIHSHRHTQNSLAFPLSLSLSFPLSLACAARICQFIAHTSALECQNVFLWGQGSVKGRGILHSRLLLLWGKVFVFIWRLWLLHVWQKLLNPCGFPSSQQV